MSKPFYFDTAEPCRFLHACGHYDQTAKAVWYEKYQIIDGALNATFSVFQATHEEFDAIFPGGQDMEYIEDFLGRVDERQAEAILGSIWERPILKRDAQGVHGTLYYQWQDRRDYLPNTKREVDWEDSAVNEAQRRLFRSHR